MNKAQKWAIEICLLLIVASILVPPFNQYRGERDTAAKAMIIKSEWNFIWTTNKVVAKSTLHESLYQVSWNIQYRKIKFNILILEWIAIIALGGFFFLYFRKNN